MDEVVHLIQPRHHCILREKVREQVQCYNKCFQMGLAGTTTLADDALFPSSTAAFRGSERCFELFRALIYRVSMRAVSVLIPKASSRRSATQ